MKSLDALAASHLRQAQRPRHAPWFDDDGARDAEVPTIGSLIATPSCTVTDSTSLAEVRRLLAERSLPAVAVIDPSTSLCGVLTATDVLRAIEDDEWTAADAMSDALTIRASASIETAAQLMVEHGASEILVTDAVGQVLGVVTALDIARYLAA